MSKNQLTRAEIEEKVEDLRNSRKYKSLALPPETIRDLLEQELPRHRHAKDALKIVRKKLHNIVAPYLGDPDYEQAYQDLKTAKQDNQEAYKDACKSLLAAHASTLERIPILENFYPRIFETTGMPGSILDLACGLHPLGLPWMGLSATTKYYAYDLHLPRVNFLNKFFGLEQREPLAFLQDILIHPPQIKADVAFFFKEAHRFEQREKGSNRTFWQAIKVHYLLVSLPTSSLSGKHDLQDKHRRLVYESIAGLPWEVTEILFENEMVFCMRKD